ncbi:MAG: hypothetical protein JXL84_07135 [Deltaproteobacteria bacterium]|nr:hypothetical protein [Deltaproteobacteria bacterium]
MKRLLLMLNVLALVLAMSANAAGEVKLVEWEILHGLEEVMVVVERIKPEIERDGLYSSTLQSDVELKLRMAGMKILEEDDDPQRTDVPYLYVLVDALKCSKGYAYKVQLSLREPIRVIRNNVRVLASTLSFPGGIGVTPHLSEIREEVRDQVDEFTQAWSEANPKR